MIKSRIDEKLGHSSLPYASSFLFPIFFNQLDWSISLKIRWWSCLLKINVFQFEVNLLRRSMSNFLSGAEDIKNKLGLLIIDYV